MCFSSFGRKSGEQDGWILTGPLIGSPFPRVEETVVHGCTHSECLHTVSLPSSESGPGSFLVSAQNLSNCFFPVHGQNERGAKQITGEGKRRQRSSSQYTLIKSNANLSEMGGSGRVETEQKLYLLLRFNYWIVHLLHWCSLDRSQDFVLLYLYFLKGSGRCIPVPWGQKGSIMHKFWRWLLPRLEALTEFLSGHAAVTEPGNTIPCCESISFYSVLTMWYNLFYVFYIL